ncbi:MAG: ribokinase [Rhodoglobus sp.]
MGKVIVIGSINDDIVASASRHPGIGETVVGVNLAHSPGGKGANQAVASARAGAETSMIGLVGNDATGQDLIKYLETSGVEVSGVGQIETVSTGTALITVAKGDNTIVVIPGANKFLSQKHVGNLRVSRGDVVVAQFETPIETTIFAFRRARSAGATTVLNPAPAASVPSQLLDLVDVLVVNEHEYALLFGGEPELPLLLPRAQEASFSGRIVATLGSDGVLTAGNGEATHCEGLSVEAVDSTGAGDCFVGYLAAGLADGLPFDCSIARANRAAALSVTKEGAASSIPTANQLDALQ